MKLRRGLFVTTPRPIAANNNVMHAKPDLRVF